jgi:superfamily II DNA/RNA helicase
MNLTPQQAQYFAYELTRQRSGKDRLDKLTSALLDAQVELTPHQVEAALFAFRSPLGQGVILADEVGLGKTIEAGLIISQKWAERKRRILIIVPANLRKQWSQELMDKFFLPSIILENKTYKEQREKGNRFPFEQSQIVITSYHYARANHYDIRDVQWDMVVLDEAHKLKNVYRTDSKIARVIKEALDGKPKVLLTATPLQNTLLELYGLISLIDPYIFGDLKSFKIQFSRLSGADHRYNDLRQRIAPVCHRTLRRDVQQYVKYTQRRALVEHFSPGDDEMMLYDLVSEYLRRETLYALPAGQRQLMTLILRRLLASSTFAIKGTFEGLAEKLAKLLKQHEKNGTHLSKDEMKNFSEAQEAEIAKNFEDYDDVKEEWKETEEDHEENLILYSDFELEQIRHEQKELESFAELAHKIDRNAKGERLKSALEQGFNVLKEIGAPEKVLIFTESTRTQNYIYEHLEKISEYKGKIVLFNGTNSDRLSKDIYKQWEIKHKGTDALTGSPSADMRAALVDKFRQAETKIMIATEAGAEGINLQFCSFIINYDLPWNPQRVEQRIGRCHRFGQKHDVVVLNFINERNAADQRVYELLKEKFQLFEGVFGASDEVLGAIESGVDFERKVLEIFRTCRTDEEINRQFDLLKAELRDSINEEMDRTRQELLRNLDAEVVDKVKLKADEDIEQLDKYHEWLWKLTHYSLADHASFDHEQKVFELYKESTFVAKDRPAGRYLMLPKPELANPTKSSIFDWLIKARSTPQNTYRAGHPLALEVLSHCKQYIPEPLVGKSGWLSVAILDLSFNSDYEEQLLFAGVEENGLQVLDSAQCKQLLRCNAKILNSQVTHSVPAELLNTCFDQQQTEEISSNKVWLNDFYEKERDKIERWAEDCRQSLRAELKDLEQEIKLRRAEARKMLNLEDKIKTQRQIKDLEMRQADKRFQQHQQEQEIDQSFERFLDDIEQRIKQTPQRKQLFTCYWTIVA